MCVAGKDEATRLAKIKLTSRRLTSDKGASFENYNNFDLASSWQIFLSLELPIASYRKGLS